MCHANDQHRVRDSDQCTLLTATFHDPQEPDSEIAVLRADGPGKAASTKADCSHRFLARVRVERCLPADSLFSGRKLTPLVGIWHAVRAVY